MDKNLLKFLRKCKTMVISTNGETLWATKVYYALDRGFVFLVEKEGRTLKNILKNCKVSFTIDMDRPDYYVQGEGCVKILGEPGEFHDERSSLLYKIPQDALFVKSGHVYIARLVPDYIKVTDMRNERKIFNAQFSLDELKERKIGYFRALRPWSFQQSITALVFGAILAQHFNLILFILSLISLILIHGSFNAFSDYFDFVTNVDRPTTMGSAGSRVLVDRIMDPKKFLIYVISLFITGSIIGTVLMILKNQIIPYVLIGLIAGILYGIPKIGWKWIALGDLAVFLAFGPGIFLGSYVLQGGVPGISEILISISLGFVIVAILHGNNWRDMDDDLKAGVRTVANILGEKGSMIYYLSLIWLSYPLFVFAVYFNPKFFPILGSFLTIPWAVKLTKIALNKSNWNRNLLDVLTANFTALHMYFSVGFMLIYITLLHFL